MQLSVIILNYNVRYFLEQCLQSVQRAIVDIEAEIIVIDNASADGSCAMIEEKFPSVILIKNSENAGFSKGNNQGGALAKGKYICILNPDTLIAEDTFTKLITFMEKQENPGITGIKLIDGTGGFLRESKRGIPTPRAALFKVTGLYKWFPKRFGRYYAMHLGPDESGPVDVLVGAFMFMERTVYQQAGGFDEGCFMYSDDIDLSYRILQYGYQNYYFPETVALHYKGESTLRDEHYLRHFRQAMCFFYKKHFKPYRFFDMFLRLGIWFFSLVKVFQARTSEKKKYRPKAYIVISNSPELSIIIEKITGKKAEIMGIEEVALKKPSRIPTEIIFDGNYMSNRQIIHLLEQLQHNKHTFKIRPQDCNFMLGSHHRNAKGAFIIF